MVRCAMLAAALGIALVAPTQAEIGPQAPAPSSHIVLPADGDEYSKLVARAASGDKDVDFRAMRFAYLKSAARKRADGLVPGGDLRAEIVKAVKAGDDRGVRDASERLLSVNYTDMMGHRFLRAACAHLRDEACAAQAHFVEFGLLDSIIRSGDGKTCPTGWEVVSVSEEYFILGVMGAQLQMQSLINGPPSCDAMATVDESGKATTYYFRIGAVLEDERAMFAH